MRAEGQPHYLPDLPLGEETGSPGKQTLAHSPYFPTKSTVHLPGGTMKKVLSSQPTLSGGGGRKTASGPLLTLARGLWPEGLRLLQT